MKQQNKKPASKDRNYKKPKSYHVPNDFYRFKSSVFKFGKQQSRNEDGSVKERSSSFYARDNQYVYKSCEMLNNDQAKLDLLNDVLFSHAKHPNSPCEHSLVFSVITHQPSEFVCPICLFTPVAPRITKCGHIFCCDCILQHIATSKAPALCPVCFQPITAESLVRADLRLYDNPMKSVTMKKIIRNRHNCCCFECNGADDMKYLATASQKSSNFNRFSLADPKYAESLIMNEVDSLTAQSSIYSQPEYLDQRKLAMLETTIEQVTAEKAPEKNEARFFLEPPSDFTQFYQEINGRPVFMDRLSTQIFSKSFKNQKEMPDEFTTPVLKVTTQTVTQKFRKQNPKLGYLPSGVEVQFVLLDLSAIAPPNVMKRFEAEINERIKQDSDSDDYGEEEEFNEFRFQSPDMSPEFFPTLDDKPQAPQAKTPTIESKPQKSAWSSVKPVQFKKKTMDEDFPSLSSGTPIAAPAKPVSAWGKATSKNAKQIKKDDDFPSLFSAPQPKTQGKIPKRTSSWGAVSPK